MNLKKILWTKSAQSDLIEIVEYISSENPENAQKIFEKIKAGTNKLITFPKRGRVVPELKNIGLMQYHELVIAPWRIIYRITPKEIFIIAVIDSRRNLEDVLLKRLLDIQ